MPTHAFPLNSGTAKMHAENTFKIVLYLHMHEVQQVHQRLRIPIQ